MRKAIWAVCVSVSLLAAAPAGAEEGFTSSDVNLRAGPGTDYDVIALIPKDSDIDIWDCSGGWCEVTFEGMLGYANEDYLRSYACLFDDDPLFCE